MMPVVFIEPRPKGDPEGSPIKDYSVETSASNVLSTFATQQGAIDWAKEQGYIPLIAHVRRTQKGNRDHWQRV
jgi:hypothetical protein